MRPIELQVWSRYYSASGSRFEELDHMSFVHNFKDQVVIIAGMEIVIPKQKPSDYKWLEPKSRFDKSHLCRSLLKMDKSGAMIKTFYDVYERLSRKNMKENIIISFISTICVFGLDISRYFPIGENEFLRLNGTFLDIANKKNKMCKYVNVPRLDTVRKAWKRGNDNDMWDLTKLTQKSWVYMNYKPKMRMTEHEIRRRECNVSI